MLSGFFHRRSRQLIATVVRPLSELSAAGRVLVANAFAFSFGFYMMLPFLADHLSTTLGLPGWAVGLVVGSVDVSSRSALLREMTSD